MDWRWEGFVLLVGYFLVGITLLWVWSPWTIPWWSIYPTVKVVDCVVGKKWGFRPFERLSERFLSRRRTVYTTITLYWIFVLSLTLYLISTNQ